jgi:hypothetical protein
VFNSRRGKEIFLYSTESRQTPKSNQPLIQWVAAALSPEVKRPERETDHLPPSSAGLKNVELYIRSPFLIHGVVLN